MEEQVLFPLLSSFLDAWNADVRAGVLSATLDREETLSMEAMHV